METAAQSVESCTEPTDPRIRRSRQMLQDAMGNLLTRKEFEDISIGEIAAEAGLNRATFYLHYPDKNALLQAMNEVRFNNLIERRGIVLSCDGAVRSIALGVLDYFVESVGCPGQLSKMALDSSVVPIVRSMLMRGFELHPPADPEKASLVATTVAWAIYGAAREWFLMPSRPQPEEMATRIDAMVKPLFNALA